MERDQKGYYVVKRNELIQRASYDLTAIEQKFLCYVISKIKPTDKEFERVIISAIDFADITGIDRRNVYREFQKMAESFKNKAHWIKIENEDVELFQVFLKPRYNERMGNLSVILDPDLKKYLLELSGNYTLYELWNILSLKSKYSIRLYELYKSYAYQKENTFDIDHLKGMLCCENYKNFADFKKRVLEPAVNEINKLTDLNVEYQTIRKGKGGRISKIQFSINRKHSLDAYSAYLKTVENLNKKRGNIPGQQSLFDLELEDFENRGMKP